MIIGILTCLIIIGIVWVVLVCLLKLAFFMFWVALLLILVPAILFLPLVVWV